MSTFDESVLQAAPTAPPAAPTVQDLHAQLGHTIWFFSTEALRLPIERRVPLKDLKGKLFVACVDHTYPDINPSVDLFSSSSFDQQPLGLHTKTAYSVADEYRTFAGQRGSAILEELLDADADVARNVWRWLFPQGISEATEDGARRARSIAELQLLLPGS